MIEWLKLNKLVFQLKDTVYFTSFAIISSSVYATSYTVIVFGVSLQTGLSSEKVVLEEIVEDSAESSDDEAIAARA